MEVLLQAVDNDGEPVEATVKLAGVPPKDSLILIEADSGTYPLTVIDQPFYEPAMGAREPQVTVAVALIGEDIETLREVMRCAHELRTQEGPR